MDLQKNWLWTALSNAQLLIAATWRDVRIRIWYFLSKRLWRIGAFFSLAMCLHLGAKFSLSSEEGVRAQWVWMGIVIKPLYRIPTANERREEKTFFFGGGGVLNFYFAYVILHCCEIITLLLWLLPKRPTGRGYIKLLIGGKGLLITGKGVRCWNPFSPLLSGTHDFQNFQ